MSDDLYQTRDLGLAAFLAMGGHKYELRPDPADGKSIWFDFEPAARADKERYFRGEAVSARDYYAAIRAIKARLFWGQRSR